MPNTPNKALLLPFLFCKFCISHIEYLPPANFCVVLRGQQQQKDSESMEGYTKSGFIILLRSWKLYTEAAIGTLGRHLVQHSSSVTQRQCLHQQSIYFAQSQLRP